MTGKWRYFGTAMAVALSVAVVPVQGQRGQGARGPGARGAGGPFFGQSVDVALENQEALGLDQEQVQELTGLKGVLDGEVATLVGEMKALHEGIRSGDVDRDEGMRELTALRGEFITASAPLQGRIQEVLTVEQHNKLQPLVREGRTAFGRSGPQGARGRSALGRSGAQGGRVGAGFGARGNGRGLPGGQGLRSAQMGRMNRSFRSGRRGPGGQQSGIRGGGWGFPG